MKTDCLIIRREIDESDLDVHFTLEVTEHLSRCEQCRRFQDDQRTLRGLMAELETVGAPADFDFRLRARLAREQPRNGFAGLLRMAQPIGAIALLLLIGIMVVVVKSWRSPVDNPVAANKPAAAAGGSVAPTAPTGTDGQAISLEKDGPAKKEVNTISDSQGSTSRKHQNVGERHTGAKDELNRTAGNAPRFHTRDSAGTGAEMITPQSFGGLVVVPVDAREFRLSVDNGRGVARTISLPSVTFGSQRLVAREASFVPASSARGNW